MNRIQVSALALALTALSSQAFAGKTVDQVEAERLQAVRTGNIVSTIDGTGNAKLNEVFPGQYPQQAQPAGKTRAQVEAERQEAVRTGNVASSIDGTGNAKLNEVFPGQYPAAAKVAGKTREQVEQERQVALRTGAMNFYPAY